MLDGDLLRHTFESGLIYDRYVGSGTPEQRENWRRVYDQAHLNERQRALLTGFVRQMNVLVISGIWCGDCVQQCPLLQRIAEFKPDRIRLRFVDRDEHATLSRQMLINGGWRVPVVIFLSEDLQFVGMYADRTLSRYRALAARQLGPSCPLPGAPVEHEELLTTLQDWLNEFERVQLLLRLSGRLREKHGD